MMMTMKNILWIVPALLVGGCAVDDTQTMEPVAHNGNVLRPYAKVRTSRVRV